MKRRVSYISLCRFFFFSFIITIAQWQVLLTYRINFSETTISKPHEYDSHSLFVQRVLAPGRKRVDDWTGEPQLRVRERESPQYRRQQQQERHSEIHFNLTKQKQNADYYSPKVFSRTQRSCFSSIVWLHRYYIIHDLRCVGGGGYCDIFIIILNIMIYTTFRKEVFF